MNLSAIDNEQQLYVIRSGKGVTCYGWDVLDRKARAVAAWLAELDTPNRDAKRAAATWLAELDKNPPGTADHFQICNNILDRRLVPARRRVAPRRARLRTRAPAVAGRTARAAPSRSASSVLPP
jgi:hypothetical protein